MFDEITQSVHIPTKPVDVGIKCYENIRVKKSGGKYINGREGFDKAFNDDITFIQMHKGVIQKILLCDDGGIYALIFYAISK